MARVTAVTSKLRGPFTRLAQQLKVVERKAPRYDKGAAGRLAPNQHYHAGKRAAAKPKYEYLTDRLGRIKAAYAENLQLKPDGQARASNVSNVPGKSAGDEAGHLFGDRFDGAGGINNLVAQARELNQGKWKQMEDEWEKALRAGQRVEVLIKVRHAGDDARPTGFNVEYYIDGVRRTRMFEQ